MKISRKTVIQILQRIETEDDYWMDITNDFYDDIEDDWPSPDDLMDALGITEKERERVRAETIRAQVLVLLHGY